MSGRGFVTRDDVEQNLDLIEKVTSLVSTSDEFMSAMIANQAIMSAKLDAVTGGGGVGIAGVKDPRNLPVGLAGIALESIETNGQGTALFVAGGDRFVAEVQPERNDIEAQDYVIINGEGNSVIEGPSSIAAVNSELMGGSTSRNSFTVNGQVYSVPAVVEPGKALHIGNQDYDTGRITDIDSSLQAGQTKVFARVAVDATQVILIRGFNQSQHSTVEYRVRVDGEVDDTLTGTSPLAVPPDYYEPVEDGYMVAEDEVEIVIEETSGGSSYSSVEATIQAILVDV